MAISGALGTRILVDEFDLTAHFREATLTAEGTALDTTTFGQSAVRRKGGLKDGSVSASGFFEEGAGASHEVLRVALNAAGVVTVSLDGLDLGKVVGLLGALETSYEIGDPIDGLVTVDAEWEGDGGLDFGFSLHDLAEEAATGNGTNLDNTTATTAGGVAQLHVTDVTGTLTAKVQHSVDNVVWADLITFTAATTATAERKTVAGTVNRHTRARFEVTTGPATFQLSFARR